MANKKISDLNSFSTVATGDMLIALDVSDTTQSLLGSTKKISVGDILTSPTPIGFTTPSTGRFSALTVNGYTTCYDLITVQSAINGIGILVDAAQVAPNTYSPMLFRYATATVGSVVCGPSATTFNTSSDYRLKDNQAPLSGSGAFIDALKPTVWNWKLDGTRGCGFIAHEFADVSPGSVSGIKDGIDYQSMQASSSEVIANLVAEIQDLRKRLSLANL